MPPPVRHVQEIRLDDVVKRVLAKERNGKLVIMLQDVQDIFENARRFEYDGIGIPFMTNDDDERILPLRVEYYEGCILDVVLGDTTSSGITANGQAQAVPESAPIPIPSSPPTTAPTSPSSSFPGTASPLSSIAASIAPLSIVKTMTALSIVKEASEEESEDKTRHYDSRSKALSSQGSFSNAGEPSLIIKPEPQHRPLSPENVPDLHNEPLEVAQQPMVADSLDMSPVESVAGPVLESPIQLPPRNRPAVQTVHTLPDNTPPPVYDAISWQTDLGDNTLSPTPVVYNPFDNHDAVDARQSPQPSTQISTPGLYYQQSYQQPLSALQIQIQQEQQRQQQLMWHYQQQQAHNNQHVHSGQQPTHPMQLGTPHDQYNHHLHLQQQYHQPRQRQFSLAEEHMQPEPVMSAPVYENLSYHMQDLHRPRQHQFQNLPWESSQHEHQPQSPSRQGSITVVSPVPPIPPRPHNSSTTSLASQSSVTATLTSAATAPLLISTTLQPAHRITTAQSTDSGSRISLPLSPTSPTPSTQNAQQSIHSFSSPPNNPHIIMNHELTHRGTMPSRQGSISSRHESDSGLDSASDNSSLHMENENVKDLKMQLRRIQDQNLAYVKKNHALTKSSQIMSVKIINKATLVQNTVQAVLTQIHELHENPIPRLFVVLPELVVDSVTEPASGSLGRRSSNVVTAGSKPSQAAAAAAAANDQRKFRLYFLCECGSYTKPLPNSGVNHVHFVEHEGYEIVRPTEFFQKYGAFIRSFSHLIRNGVHCGTVLIPPLISGQQQHAVNNDNNSIYQAYAVGPETLRNKILDTRLAEAIRYLDSIDTDIRTETSNEDGSLLGNGIPFISGKDIRQLQPYLKLNASDHQNLGNLYRFLTTRGYVKWICEDHHKVTVNKLNDIAFQQEISSQGGNFDLRTGRARIQLLSDKEANVFYRSMVKVPALNIYELDVALKWAFTESDLQRLVQAVSDSKVGALSLDGGKQKADSSSGVKLMNFGKKYDPLLKLIFSTKLQSIKIANMPSLINKLSLRNIRSDQSYSIKALHLSNVGALDFAPDRGSHLALANIGLDSSSHKQPQTLIVKTFLTSFWTLTEISLPRMNIRDDGVQILTEMSRLPKTLRYINLSDNGITPVGGKQIATFLAKEGILTYLDLGMNSIGDETLAIIIGALGPKLSVLNLESTGFGDKAAKALEKMVETFNSSLELEPQLEYLNLATNGWATSGIQTLGRILLKLRLEAPLSISPLLTESTVPSATSPTSSSRPELGSAESFLLINSMIRTSHISLPSDLMWHETPNILKQYFALTATKDSYDLSSQKAQDSIVANSRLKVLRLSDAGLTEGAARYLTGKLDVSVLTKLDLRRCIRLFKPKEMLNILARIYPSSSSEVYDDYAQQQQQQYHRRPSQPQGPTPFGIVGTPRNYLRFVHLNSTGVDDHVARILSQDLQSGFSCLERLDIGSNHLTHVGITMILNALCQNTSLQHLNLGQNFDTPNTVYASAAALAAQNTRDAFSRFMTMNRTLEILYFTTMGMDVVAEGLKVNSTLRSLVFDRLVGGLKEIGDFGHALAINRTLMRFKVYDNRIAPFLQAFYGNVHDSQYNHHHHHHGGSMSPSTAPSSQQIHYVDPFRDIKQEALRTIDKGMSFNSTLIELQWPELFDKLQPWTERLETALTRNMMRLKMNSQGGGGGHDPSNGTKDGTSISTFRGSRGGQNGGMLSRGVSVLSTSSTLSTNSTNSSDSLSIMTSQQTNNGLYIAGGGGGGGSGASGGHVSSGSNGSNRGQYGHHSMSSSPPQDSWDERRLAQLELSSWTIGQLRKAMSREQQQQQHQQQGRAALHHHHHQQQQQQQQQQQHHHHHQQQQQRAPRIEADAHIMQRFQKK
ncbi:hypothetical protein BG004_007210 [Podila humilis]|nr:hypothetical protein BG004_007210 [Podila humilis]